MEHGGLLKCFSDQFNAKTPWPFEQLRYPKVE